MSDEVNTTQPLEVSAVDYRLEAMQLTSLDRKMLAALLTRGTGPCQSFPASIEQFKMHVIREWSGLKQCRERDECLAKLQRLGLVENERT